MAGSGVSIEERLGRIDRRWVYAGLFLITLAPMVFKWKLPLFPTEPGRKFYQAIEEIPTDKIVFISSNWEAGTQAENRPQMVAIVRHLIRRGIKFAVLSLGNPAAPAMAKEAISRAIELEGKQGEWKYGSHWCSIGYKIGDNPWLRTFSRDIPAAAPKDDGGKDLASLEMMKGVKKFGPEGQVPMMIDITGSATVESWYEFLSPTNCKIALACTAVMAPEQYPFLDSGQLSGLLTGMKGAAEYEQLVKAPGFGLDAMAGQSFAHLYILILLVLGNFSVVSGWLRARGSGR